MSDEAKKALEEFLISMLQVAKDGAAWAQGQIPLVLQEKLAYDFAIHVVWAVLITALLIWYFGGLRKRVAAVEDVNDVESALALVKMVGGGFGVVIFGIGLFVEILPTLFKIYFAPRLYLLEWARELVR